MKTKPVPFVDVTRQHKPIQSELEAAVLSVMRQGDYVMGQAVKEFESNFAQACGVPHGVGVACGTDAIALGLQACGIGQGDEVILPANTFVATLIGVVRSGATPVLVDCEVTTGLMDLAAAERAITPSTRAILPVHLYGQMVSPTMLIKLASTYDLLIFEDAAQAHLAEREGYRAGSIGIGAAFSFYPSKNLGAMGDGGIFITRDAEVAEQMRILRNYGAPKKYFHTEVGSNSRLDTMQAAILQVKLPHLKSWNEQRNDLAIAYQRALQPLIRQGLSPLQNHTGNGHVYHLYIVRVVRNGEANFTCGVDRDQLIELLEARGIQTGIHYPLPCHLQPAFQFLGYRKGDFPVAEKLADEILSLPIFPGMTIKEVDRVAQTLTTVLAAANLKSAESSQEQNAELLVSV